MQSVESRNTRYGGRVLAGRSSASKSSKHDYRQAQFMATFHRGQQVSMLINIILIMHVHTRGI